MSCLRVKPLVGDVPFIATQPNKVTVADYLYTYPIFARAVDDAATVTFEVVSKPNWLQWNDQGDGTGILEGIPGEADTGKHQIEIRVTDSKGQSATQRFEVVVLSQEKANFLPFVTQ